jgi:prepilin-type N-terminal cleavage/methylation domain-containing protein
MNKRDGGFTLIEALVATTVFALVLSALYQGLTTGWRGLKKANQEEVATSVLAAQLASSGVEGPLEASASSGTAADGIAWQSVIEPYTPSASGDSRAPASYLGYWVTVTVRWREARFGAEHALQAKTLKLKKAL